MIEQMMRWDIDHFVIEKSYNSASLLLCWRADNASDRKLFVSEGMTIDSAAVSG
jgi:hypothetical protein